MFVAERDRKEGGMWQRETEREWRDEERGGEGERRRAWRGVIWREH